MSTDVTDWCQRAFQQLFQRWSGLGIHALLVLRSLESGYFISREGVLHFSLK
jgi:hypothetical protein